MQVQSTKKRPRDASAKPKGRSTKLEGVKRRRDASAKLEGAKRPTIIYMHAYVGVFCYLYIKIMHITS